MPKAGIQSNDSWNRKPEVPASAGTKTASRRRERQKVRKAVPRASQRTRSARWRGTKAITMAPRRGRKMMAERIGKPFIGPGPRPRRSSAEDQDEVSAGQHDQPDGDAEGIVLDTAGLDAPEVAPRVDRHPADPVDGAVDDLAVEPPQALGDRSADPHEQQVVKVVEVPLVDRAGVEALDASRQGGDP